MEIRNRKSETRMNAGREVRRQKSEVKSRFLAQFTLSPFASLRAVRSGMANGLGMTAKEDRIAALGSDF